MNTKTQIFCAACGIAFVILLTVGWWVIAGFVPPPSPELSASEIAEFYRQNTGTIRFGILLAMFSMSLTLPWIAVIAVQMRRIEGEFPVLTYTQLVAGAATLAILLIPTLLWTTAAFRPERSPELILLLNDFAWLLLVMTFSPFTVQLIAIGLAIMPIKISRLYLRAGLDISISGWRSCSSLVHWSRSSKADHLRGTVCSRSGCRLRCSLPGIL